MSAIKLHSNLGSVTMSPENVTGEEVLTLPSVTGTVVVIDATTTTINLAGIPTSASGLSSGDVWSNSGVLTIVT